jgi:ATP-binding cassette subfamily B (MDR/TAP) protein 1
MLDGEDFECQNYLKHLGEAARVTVKYGVFTGFAMGFVWCVMILAYALGFWYGSKLISDEVANFFYILV